MVSSAGWWRWSGRWRKSTAVGPALKDGPPGVSAPMGCAAVVRVWVGGSAGETETRWHAHVQGRTETEPAERVEKEQAISPRRIRGAKGHHVNGGAWGGGRRLSSRPTPAPRSAAGRARRARGNASGAPRLSETARVDHGTHELVKSRRCISRRHVSSAAPAAQYTATCTAPSFTLRAIFQLACRSSWFLPWECILLYSDFWYLDY